MEPVVVVINGTGGRPEDPQKVEMGEHLGDRCWDNLLTSRACVGMSRNLINQLLGWAVDRALDCPVVSERSNGTVIRDDKLLEAAQMVWLESWDDCLHSATVGY